MKDKQLVIGIGTGRCGTLSLCKLLNLQSSCVFSHELRPLPVIWAEPKHNIIAKFSGILERSERPICGDVAFYHLWYLPVILEEFKNTKVIVLKRDRTATIDSYKRKLKEWTLPQPVHHWTNINRQNYADSPFDSCFPKYDIEDLDESIGMYYDTYYAIVKRYKALYQTQLKEVQTETFFDDPNQINQIFDWIGVPVAGRDLTPVHEYNYYKQK
jgi:hypothetical protein